MQQTSSEPLGVIAGWVLSYRRQEAKEKCGRGRQFGSHGSDAIRNNGLLVRKDKVE